MRICFLLKRFPALSQTFILHQITDLIDKGHDVSIVSLYQPLREKQHNDVAAYNLPAKTHYTGMPRHRLKRLLKALWLVLRYLPRAPFAIVHALNIIAYGREVRALKLLYLVVFFLRHPEVLEADVLHCHFGPVAVVGQLAKELLGASVPLVATFHGTDMGGYVQRHGLKEYRLLFARCGSYTVNTRFSRERLVKLGAPKERITIIPAGLRPERFGRGEKQPGNKPLQLITVARLVYGKGLGYAMGAMKELQRRGRDFTYLLVGDGPMLGVLHALVDKLGLGETVSFYGAADQEEVRRQLARADVFLLPSIALPDGSQETQGLVLQEAQAGGLPVIATRIGGIAEGMRHQHTGLLVAEKDSQAIADAVGFFIDRPQAVQDMGRAGQKWAREHYDIRSLNERLLRLYKGLRATV